MNSIKSRLHISDTGSLDKIKNLIMDGYHNVETQFFAMPENLIENLDGNIEKFRKKKEELKIKKLIMHGPLFDLSLTSRDSEIANISSRRYEQALYAARSLNIEKIVFHTQYNTQLRLPAYIKSWLNGTAEFFSKVLEKAGNEKITIFIENMFDEDPDLIGKLMETVSSPRIGVCLDVGHVNVYSVYPPSYWIKKLSPYLKYFHLSDNSGKVDKHLPLGRGTLDFCEIFKTIEEERIYPEFCIEMYSEKDHWESIEYLNSLDYIDLS
ncbi:MAG: sugar phosphate isomerase/epimerase [Candidatus Eremiobacteraeota bacterium]|nr:sugar phosphate isomerase/epimerase [Candidatus Eremiobacteraeota bacterium]